MTTDLSAFDLLAIGELIRRHLGDSTATFQIEPQSLRHTLKIIENTPAAGKALAAAQMKAAETLAE